MVVKDRVERIGSGGFDTHVREGSTLGGNDRVLQVGRESREERQETTLGRANRYEAVTTTRGQRRAQHSALARTHCYSSPGIEGKKTLVSRAWRSALCGHGPCSNMMFNLAEFLQRAFRP